MVFAEESTTAAFLLRARREGIRDFGACMAPFTAFQILQGVETLPLRMEKHVDERAPRRRVPRRAPVRRRRSAIPELPGASRPRARGAAAAARLRRGVQLRDQGHARAGAAAHRVARAVLAPRQRRRREVAGDPSRRRRRTSACRPRTSRRPASREGTIRLSIGLEDRRRPDRGPVARAVRGGEGVSSRWTSPAVLLGARVPTHSCNGSHARTRCSGPLPPPFPKSVAALAAADAQRVRALITMGTVDTSRAALAHAARARPRRLRGQRLRRRRSRGGARTRHRRHAQPGRECVGGRRPRDGAADRERAAISRSRRVPAPWRMARQLRAAHAARARSDRPQGRHLRPRRDRRKDRAARGGVRDRDRLPQPPVAATTWRIRTSRRCARSPTGPTCWSSRCARARTTGTPSNADVLAALGPDGHVVNIARGSVIDEAALIAALRDGVIAGAGLDVFEHEPERAAPNCSRCPNVVAAPHVGGGTLEAQAAMQDLVCANLDAFFAGPRRFPTPRSRPGGGGLTHAPCRRRPRGLRVHRLAAARCRRSRRSCSCTAPRTTTACGRCSRATSRTTGATCWRSTCPATGARAARRSRPSTRSPTGCRACSTRPASTARPLVGHSLGSLAVLACAAASRRDA